MIQKLTADLIPQDLNPDVVIVGGGPVGLWTGIQTSLLSGKQVTIIEKYNEYQRADIRLNIDASSLGGIPDDDKLKELTRKWAAKAVPIKQMETELTQRAHELGITILKGYQADPKTLPDLFPRAKVFIGADGARSEIRKKIFDDQFSFNSNLQYMAQVQYVINEKHPEDQEGRSVKIKNLAETYSMQKFAEHLVLQTLRPQEDGSCRVNLQIFIDKATYDEMAEASFKNPYYFETDLNKVPDSLREVLIKWWGAREEFHNEIISAEHSEKHNKLTVLSLNSYAAQNVVKVDENGRTWALVGDAAAAFPFFRAVNNGLLLGTKLAKCISEGFEKETVKHPLSSYLNSYSRYAKFRGCIERIKASVKNLFVNFSKLWLRISNRAPLQPIQLSNDQKNNTYMLGVDVWTRLSGTALSEAPV